MIGYKNHGRRHGRHGTDPTPGIGGFYVPLQSVVIASDGDPFEFNDIDQGYETLVLDISARIAGITGSFAAIAWNGGTSNYDLTWLKVKADVGGTIESGFQNSYPGVTVPDIYDDSHSDPLFTEISARFPFYSLSSRVKSCLWQSSSVGDDFGSNAWGSGRSVANVDDGQVDVDPITSIQLYVTSGPVITGAWGAGSRATLAGIEAPT